MTDQDVIAPEETAATTTEESGPLERLREALVAAHPDAVAELIGGADIDALLDSVATATAAYARLREAAREELAVGVPRGGGVREADPALLAGLSPEAKIALALAGARR